MMFEKELSEAEKAINPVCFVVGADEGNNPVALRSFLFGSFHIISAVGPSNHWSKPSA